MNNNTIFSLIAFLLLAMSCSVQAARSTEDVRALISASEKARQPHATQADIEHYLAFFADDFVDVHVAYDVSFTGKAHLRKGISKKVSSMVSFAEEVERIVLGTSTAVAVVNEDSKYYKNDKFKHFKGRTILVLEFNQQGLIQQMQRYQD